MSEINKILVGYDFSESGNDALKTGIKWAKKFQSNFKAVYGDPTAQISTFSGLLATARSQVLEVIAQEIKGAQTEKMKQEIAKYQLD